MSNATVTYKLGDIIDLLATVRYLNEAVFMAASNSALTKDATNAIQAVAGEMDSKLLSAEERIEEVMETLK
jgi:hypothetical protein